MKENLRLRIARTDKVHSVLEACLKCAEKVTKHDGERKKHVDKKENMEHW